MRQRHGAILAGSRDLALMGRTPAEITLVIPVAHTGSVAPRSEAVIVIPAKRAFDNAG
jgi:hypothetical protein